ncbi:MAG: DUF3108 domain-containing protein [bacterium]
MFERFASVFIALHLAFALPSIPSPRVDRSFIRVGESLSYDIEVFGMVVAREDISIRGWSEIEGRNVLDLYSEVKTSGFISRIYRVHNRLRVLIDPENLLPILIEREIEEGGHTREVRIELDWKRGEALFRDRKDGGETIEKSIPLLPDTLDAVSTFYYVRGLPCDKSYRISLNVFKGDEIVPVDVDVDCSERLTLDGRTFDVFKVSQRGGLNFAAWISKDERKVPLKIIAGRIELWGIKIADVIAILSERGYASPPLLPSHPPVRWNKDHP